MSNHTDHPADAPSQVESVYVLSPVQFGMVFHDIYSPDSGVYQNQYVFSLRGRLDPMVLQRAWEHVLVHCPVLRTAFVWEGVAQPVQVVFRRAVLPWESHDWRGCLEDEKRERLLRYLEVQRGTRFDLLKPPLMRLALVQLADESFELVWNYHHVLLDGWSISLVLQDVLACYDALLRGGVPTLPRRRPYSDYIAWLLRQDQDAAEAYWRRTLEDFTSPTPLVGERPAYGSREGKGAAGTAQRQLSPAATGALHAFAMRHRLTINTLVQGAWALLLSRWSEVEDVVFGAVVTGRPPELPGMDRMIGLFINTLPVRVQVDGGAHVGVWLQRLQARQVAARAYDYSPLSDVQRWSGVPAGQPLFESIVAFENHPVEEMAGAGERSFVVERWASMGRSHYPMQLMVLPGDRIHLQLEYDGGRIEAEAAERMAGHLETLLDSVAADPGRLLSELSLLTDSERAQVLRAWNETTAEYPVEGGLRGLFRAQAARTPEAVALVCDGERLTYAQLHGRVARLAERLRARGAGVDTRVGLCVERTTEMVVGVLGIIESGAAYVPIDPAYPQERVAYMLEDASISVLLTQERLAPRLPGTAAALVCLDGAAAAPDGGPTDDAPVRVPGSTHWTSPDSLAYVIYTSGSTGRPKGVAMQQRPLLNLLAWQARAWGEPGAATTLQFATISFDVSFQEIFSCLLGGGTLVVASEDVRRDPAALLELLEREGVERLFLPYVALQHVAEVAVERGTALPRLREVTTAGEQLRVTPAIRRWFAMLGVPLHNQYGPSETHVVTALTLRGDAAGWPVLPGIGAPVANTKCYVVDAGMRPVPPGVPGELYLGGDSVARGYLGRPGLTAERFVPDPFSGEPGARLYRSGDRARWGADGEIEFLGRKDQQVKVRGFRIEPGEVETALERHPDVREALVYVREEAPGDRRLVGYVVPEEGRTIPADAELRGYLAGELPEYMVPAAFVALERLPLTPSGKIDRRALPAPERSESAAAVAPRTPAEELLGGIWAEVLGVERVGVEESFFELGGHSLLATRVISRVRQAFGVEVPLKALFDAPTVAALAGRIEALRSTGNSLAPPIERVSRKGMEGLPLSFAQQRLWLVDQLEPGSAVYNMPVALRLRGRLDTAALRASLGALVRRHEVLRTTFAEREGEPLQVVRSPAPVPLLVIDLRGLPAGIREPHAERLADAEALRPFDLARGPLLRTTLLRLAGDEHVLLFTLHHVVSDGWSTGVLVREVSALYAAFSRGEEPALPELPVQYADYAAWQRRWLSGEVLEAQVAYWRERLAGAPPLLELPTDRPRPQVQGKAGASRTLTVPAGTTLGLHRLAQREGATLFMTALAAWQLLLSRYARQQDVSVGTPTAGRTHAATEGLIGFFINMLVVRTDLSGEPSFAELLLRAREATLGAYDHQELPFEKLIEELQPERSLAHEPFFQVVFALQQAQAQEVRLRLGDLRAEAREREVRTTKFDMETTLVERDGCLEASLIYRTELWDAATIDRVLGHFATLLEAAAAEPGRRAAALPMLREAERAELLALGAARAGFPSDDTLHGLFETRARQRPGAAALSFWGERMPYAELEERSARLARWLAARGVERGVRVGIFCERTPELLVAILGVLRAGGAYVPMDPAYPAERLAFMLEDSGARVLLTQYELRERLPETAAATLALDTDWDQVERVGAGAALPQARAEDAAYVIYTSGSTGRPKGVEVEHRQVVRLFRATEGWFGFGAEDVWTLFHSAAFDFSVWEIWGALLYGGRLVVVPFLTSRDPEAFHGLLRRERVTVLSQTPSAFRQLVAADQSSAELTTLKWVVFGGEALDPATLAPWTARYGYARPTLVNMYGITETTVHVTYRPIVRADVEAGGRSPIGVAIPDLSLHVLEPGGEPAPVGVPGELHVGGAGVARGYLNRPELNRERFVADPFSIEPGARLYRSGDLARRLPGGELEYLGRLDEQVKVRGFRIELGEIEAALSRHPAVREAAVVVRDDGPGGTRLVGYAAGEGVGAGELTEHLRAGLPEYMVPSVLVVLESLPLTTNGKIDRKRLPEPGAAAVGDRGYTAPQTEMEGALAQIWAEVLRVERVGREDEFFELGGHSLLATQVVTRARQAFGVDVPLRALFEAPTLAGLAARIQGMRSVGEKVAPPIERVSREGPLPLSFAQQRLWFIDRLGPGSATYNMAFSLRVGGRLDLGALERALTGIVRRHESLRTSFPSRGGEPVQRVEPARPVRLPLVDLAGLAEPRRDAELKRLTAEETSRPFDLAEGPLLRTTVVRLAEDDAVVLFTLHHIVSDGWSMGILVREVSALYEGHTRGEEPALPELPIQYADYAVWQRAWLSGDVLDAHLAYWRERLAGAPALLELPTDRPRPPVASDAGASLRCDLGDETAGALRELSRREGVTLFMTLLSAWQLLLARYAWSEDVVVGTPIAGRTRLETEGLIGFFVNTLVLRSDLSGDPSFRDLLRQVRETTLGAYQHQELPFEKLVEELGVERSLAHGPLFQVMFTLQNNELGELRLGGVRVETLHAGKRTARSDLSLDCWEEGERLSCLLGYRTELFDEETVERMLRHFDVLLRASAADPGRAASTLPLLEESERGQVLLEWNATEREYPRRCIHEMIEEQVRRSPGAVAAVCGAERLTYAELDRRADHLAALLARHGIGPGSHVPILMERSLEVPLAMLGVMKSGAAFSPLDVLWPAARVREILDDLECGVVLVGRATPWTEDELGRPLLRLDCREPAGADAARAPVRAGLEDPIYVIYTSGSTGKPKGVVVPHRGITNRFLWMDEYFGREAAGAVLQTTRHVFDSAVWQLFWPLTGGGRTVLPGSDDDLAAGPLTALIQEQRVTMTDFVPSVFNVLVPQLVRDDGVRRSLESLRAVVVGGEQITPGTTYTFMERFPAVAVVNLYGPTEASIGCICHRVTGEEGGRIPIGRPISNTQALVLDSRRQLVPAGVPGELYLAGACLGTGYLNDAEKTRAAFVENPFPELGSGRMYRTGDRVRWLPDGSLEFLGRTDAQVKVRGFRVEPGEIEGVLRRHARVTDCAVVPREDAPGDRRLVAYVVGGADAYELRAHLRQHLPEHMVPGGFVALESLPLTPNGKLDRKALPAPDYGSGEAPFVAPRTPVEETLAAIWAEVLRLERVGAHDNFFETGGHSLLAVRIQSLVRQALGVEMPVRSLFEHPTVAALALEIERAAGWRVPTPPIVAGERAQAVLARLDRMPEEEVDRWLSGPLTGGKPDSGPASAGPVELSPEEKRLLLARKLRAEIAQGDAFPLSFAQQRLWVMHQMDPESAAYNMPYALRLVGGLSVEGLGRALTSLVRRHETLRTVFPAERGVPVQRVLPARPVLPLVTDMRRLAAAARESEVARMVREEAAHPFDLAQGPLLRVRVLRIHEAEDVVLFTMHHIVTDGWSQEVLVRDLSELYTADVEGRTPTLPDLPVQYADYAAWQRGELSGDVLEEHLDYWRRQLAGASPLLDIPTDRPRLPPLGDRAGSRSFALSLEVSQALRALSRREGSTLFMTLMAAFQELLSRWSGEDDVVVGTPVAGRTQVVVENVIGFFVNLLALRTRFSDDPSFREVVARVRESVLEGHAHQDLPFERLVDALQAERSPTITPLFQALFALQVPAREALRLGELEAARMDGAEHAAKFDLSLEMTDDGERLAGSLLFRTELFDGSTIERMLEHLARMLEQVADDAAVRLSGLTLLGPAERRLVVEEWNRTEAEYPADLCIHELFARQAGRTPDAVAVVYEGQSLTFAELDARANQVAHHLAHMGVGPEVRVGLCLERSLELMVCTLGVMKAGGAYVPLDPAHPGERIAYVLTDSGVAVLLTQERLRDRLPGLVEVRVLCVDREWAPIAAESTRVPRSGVEAENLCYVIYTSGSTGRPKGVAMHHRGVCNYIDWGVRFYGADQGGGAPVFSSMAVDLTITNLLPLFAGRPVRFLREDSPVDALAEVLRERPGFGLIKITPTHLSLLTPLLTPDEARTAARTLVVGADFLSAETTLFMQEHAPGVRLMNEYGPTETVVGCSAYLLPNGVHRAGPVPVGGPIQNLRFYVLDRHMEPVPAGVGGELYIGGAGVARGYLGRPGLSAEKFVPDPFAGTGARMYRTGDRARWQPDGNLLILGRVDNQVKVRGYRVELGEIEAVLRRHEQVSACLVVLREDRPGDRRLVAYVVGEADAGSLREHLRRSVPEYMVPGAFVRLESLPHTSTGKFDPRTLPAPGYGAVERYVAPRTPVEEALAEIWAEVLGLERTGVEESFFELGGDSILAIQVVSRARWAGVEITPRQMLEHHTISRLASVAGRRSGAEARAAEQGRPRGAVTPTPIQAAFFERGHAVPWHHNLSVLLGVDPAVPGAALEAAVHAVLGHHDALRLRFRRTESGWEQWYGEEVGIELERIDLSSASPGERRCAQAEITGRRQASLDLEHGPVGRAVLFEHGEEGRVLFLTLHHLVVDGVSWRLIREDLDRACAQAQAGRPIDLGPRSTSFQEWAASLVAYAAGDAARGQAGYWLAQGPEGIPPLPVDGEGRQTIESAREVAAQLGAEETRALLQEVPAAYRTQINDVLLCALVDAVGEWTGSSRTRLALEGHGRVEEVGPGLDLTRSVGWFTSMYPVVLDTAGAVGTAERLGRVKEQLLAVPAQGVGYGALRYLSPDVEVRRALAAQPEPGIVFNYLGQFDQGLSPGLRVRFTGGPKGPDVADENHRPHPLSMGASIVDGRLHVHWRYDLGIHRRETVERLAGRYLEALRRLIAHCREEGAACSAPECRRQG